MRKVLWCFLGFMAMGAALSQAKEPFMNCKSALPMSGSVKIKFYNLQPTSAWVEIEGDPGFHRAYQLTRRENTALPKREVFSYENPNDDLSFQIIFLTPAIAQIRLGEFNLQDYNEQLKEWIEVKQQLLCTLS